MNLKVLKDKYKIIKFDTNYVLDNKIYYGEFYSVTKTRDEVSIVVREDIDIECSNAEKNWKIIQIDGTLDFALVGILSKISSILADVQISIFVISTFNTDYILIKDYNFLKAKEELMSKGYIFLD